MNLECKNILVVGASSDISASLNQLLSSSSSAHVGFHYNSNKKALAGYAESSRVKKFQGNLSSRKACISLIDDFVSWAGKIDALIQLSGDIKRPMHWEKLGEEEWEADLSMNLVMPFFLAQRAVHHMKRKQSGRIILMSTASASHGGGTNSLAYGVSKYGIECVVKRLAKDCANYGILVNAIAPGFIMTKFHSKKMKRTLKSLEQRALLVPLKRAGTTQEVAETIMFLLSNGASYITGQTVAVSGGDFL